VRAVDRMDDIHDIRSRTFSFGAHGYNQDDVDRYLHELAERIDAGDTDWASELERFEQRSFAVVSLGYWRPDVDSYMAELGAWIAEQRDAAEPESAAPADEPEAVDEPESDDPAEMLSGWTQNIVERLRRVTEASTAPTPLAEVAGAAGDIEKSVPEVVAAAPLRLAEDAEKRSEGIGVHEAPEPLDRERDRARLFRMAMALGVEDAVSMTAAELVAAIDRAERGDGPEDAEEVTVALLRTKATLASFERMLADQVSQVTAAARLERRSAARAAEEMMRDAERRAGEIVAAAEREGDALGHRAQRYSERVRRLADRDALRRAAAAGPVAPVAVAEPEPTQEPEPMPEPEVEPEPEIEPEAVEAASEAEPEAEAELGVADSEPAGEAQPAPASAWGRLRRMLG
jgi:DivIVA domain-containing protein